MTSKIKLCDLSELREKVPAHYIINDLDLVAIRYGNEVSVLYGRCLHRGALMADGHIEGDNIICGVHGWDYRYDTGVSEYNDEEVLHKFSAVVEEDTVFVDQQEIDDFITEHPQPFQRDTYLGAYADTHPEATEPYTSYINELSRNGLKNFGHHGPSAAMGVDRNTLPKWEDIQFLPAQLASKPLPDAEEVATKVIIGPAARNPLELDMPVFVSDMSFGALSREAKIALSKGAEMAGTGICSGEGGMLPEEQENNARYFYELASDAVAVSNAALQAIGCLGMRACHTNNCPVGVATQKENLRSRIQVELSAKQLYNFFTASNDLIKVIARACGHRSVGDFNFNDLSTFNHEVHQLTGINYAGIQSNR